MGPASAFQRRSLLPSLVSCKLRTPVAGNCSKIKSGGGPLEIHIESRCDHLEMLELAALQSRKAMGISSICFRLTSFSHAQLAAIINI